MMKKGLAVLGILVMLFAICACNQTGGEETTSTANLPTEVNAYGLVGPTGAGFVNMMEKSSLGQTAIKYNVNLVTAPDAIVSKLTTGEADIAAIPYRTGRSSATTTADSSAGPRIRWRGGRTSSSTAP